MNKNTHKSWRTPRKVGECKKVGESPINLVESPRNRGEPN
jgi:hypothetical protein